MRGMRLLWWRSRGSGPLVVPSRFNRNSRNVTSLMGPEESGRWLLERMRQQVGFDSYRDKRLLDFGCGVRFSQAIINTPLEIGGYVGVDVYRPMIAFLKRKVRDDRFSYVLLAGYHALDNRSGRALTPDTPLPLTAGSFDLACMFSVITHQNPDEARCIFSMLRRYVRGDGHLFFTCFLDESIADFEDRSAKRNGGICFYHPEFLTTLVERCGWRLTARAVGHGPLIGDSFVGRPA